MAKCAQCLLSHMVRNYIGQFSLFAVSSTSLSELSDVILDKILINGWPIWLEFIYRASILAKMSLKALWEMFLIEDSWEIPV